MKQSYTFDFKDRKVIRKELGGALPQWCSHKLHYAGKLMYYELPEIILCSQQLNFRPFLIDLLELQASDNFRLNFTIPHKQIFLFFMLRGSLLFCTDAGQEISQVRDEHFLMSYYQPGKYSVSSGQGNHLAFIISIAPEWFQTIGSHYTNIRKIIKEFQLGGYPAKAMHQDRIQKPIYRNLHKMFKQMEHISPGRIDSFLRTRMTLFLEEYDKLLYKTPVAELVMEYVGQHYTELQMNVGFLCSLFDVDERTLRNQSKSIYGITPKAYYTLLRMKRAQELIRNGNTFKQVCPIIGYTSCRTFKRHYDNYLSGITSGSNIL